MTPKRNAHPITDPVIRPLRASDAEACLSLFRDTVHRINRRDYSQAQLDAWAPQSIDAAAWEARFSDHIAYVSVLSQSIIGFADMSKTGHLDRLVVSADHQRHGIARELTKRLIEHARELRCESVTTDASITAKPFFEAMGFNVVKQQTVERAGVSLTNFRMRLPLEGPPPRETTTNQQHDDPAD
ncbi:GNAT family N-acetyltransferase [Rhodopirellula sallentina]|uniref:Acetyltransferase / GCN5-related N-acetyltransferase n=1 Tax=Rhodopirellula sallentina SM41 TaxID=1263870 RepID=M5TUP2_9BACT|nr:GNAT family N-acetyltransferase [Rhodopirellula sallentina]EMI52912.1 acetyltransferase / GCN5-related N-acetyltransferase [Rhodopirellula sallentina SM41]